MFAKKELAILIPTRNRSGLLSKTISRLVKATLKSKSDQVEIVIVDNVSEDDTEIVVEKWVEKHGFIKYYRQPESRKSAEESLFYALNYVDSKYIWICGDDDFPLIDCVERVLSTINSTNANLIFFNFDRFVKKSVDKKSIKIFDNCNFSQNLIEYEKGADLFFDFGFITLTSLLPCICVKNGTIDRSAFLKLLNTSQIYSHSFALFCSYFNAKVAFSNEKLISYRVPSQDEYISNLTREKNYRYYQWTLGFVALAEKSCEIIKLKEGDNFTLKDILCSLELQPIMEFNITRNSILWCVVIRMIVSQIQKFSNFDQNKILSEDLNIRNYLIVFVKVIDLVRYNLDLENQYSYVESLLKKQRFCQNDFNNETFKSVESITVDLEDKFFVRNIEKNIDKKVPIIGVCNFYRSVKVPIIYKDKKVLSIIFDLELDSSDSLFNAIEFLRKYRLTDIKDLEVIVCYDDGFGEINDFVKNNESDNIKYINKSNIADDCKILNYAVGNYLWKVECNTIPFVASLYYLMNILRYSEDELIFSGILRENNVVFQNPLGLFSFNFSDKFLLYKKDNIGSLVKRLNLYRALDLNIIVSRKLLLEKRVKNIPTHVWEFSKYQDARFLNIFLSSPSFNDRKVFLKQKLSSISYAYNLYKLLIYISDDSNNLSKILSQKEENYTLALKIIKLFCNKFIDFIKLNIDSKIIISNGSKVLLDLNLSYFSKRDSIIISEFNSAYNLLNKTNFHSKKLSASNKKKFRKILKKISQIENCRETNAKKYLMKIMYKFFKISLQFILVIMMIFNKFCATQYVSKVCWKINNTINNLRLKIKEIKHFKSDNNY